MAPAAEPCKPASPGLLRTCAALRVPGSSMFAYLFFLLKGVRWVWIATVVLIVLSFVSSLATGPRTWYGIGGGLITLSLLLLPATRRFFVSEPATADT